MEKKFLWDLYTKAQLKELELYAKDYRDFLDAGKTERECVDSIVNLIENEGYVELDPLLDGKHSLKPGDKVYRVNMNKSIILYHIGNEPITEGMNVVGAHIDSPRLDVKQNPLMEKDGFAYLDTHYYGGIKKYQWVTIPLAIHGVIVRKDGSTVIVNIGEEEDDPVFFVSDLLIHLAQDQMEKKASVAVEGEMLDLIVGNKPLIIDKKAKKNEEADEEKEKSKELVKEGVLAFLRENYDVEEEDFLSAELEIVPAGGSREAGFDRSMILAYGQDDRVCSFAALRAILEAKKCDRTQCCILVDKEEIGSVGATGMRSMFFENTTREVLALCGINEEILLRRTMQNSVMLSTDVTSAYDPNFASVFDKNNVAFLGKGVAMNKFTGSRGKSGSNDANAEFVAMIRNVFMKNEITFQMTELGKVDQGGGGTIAYITALYGMNVIDSGVPVLNMHAPWEATSKADCYEAKRAYKAFLEDAVRV